MKGVVLAGGLGTRLHPATLTVNKHLLPIYDRPMIYYPLQSLAEAGIQDVCIVVGDLSAGEIVKLIGNGRQFGFRSVYYVYQEKSGGIAEALNLTKEFVGGSKVVVILGDNIFTSPIKSFVEACEKDPCAVARVFLAQVPDPERFGVAEFTSDGKSILNIVEKPTVPPSNWAVTGLYCYPSNVFEVIKTLVPSGRNELEITDVNNYYASKSCLDYSKLEKGEWLDAGTFDSMVEASSYFANMKKS